MKQRKLSIFITLLFYVINIFVPYSVFAAQNFTLQEYTIKVNSGSTYSKNVNANPWDTIRILIWWSNDWDSLTNMKTRFTFSSTGFTYLNPWTINSYKNFVVDKANISTTYFNPPLLNDVPMSDISANGDYHNLYYFYFKVNTWFTYTNLDVWAKIIADGYAWSNQITRTIFVNVRPHITDYYFEKAWSTVTSIKNDWSDSIDLVLKIKDYNGCTNIDWANITANLANLWYSTSETLSYVSCDTTTKTAIYKKTWITTLVATWSYNFEYTKFLAFDENNNQNDPSDTKFNSEDKVSTLALTVQTASTPTVNITSFGDDNIWGPSELSTTLDFTADQSWTYKIAAWSDSQCNWWTIIQDWTAYSSWTPTNVIINSTSLNVWTNTVYACVKNLSDFIWSANISITKDITAPSFTLVTVSPANVTTQDSTVTIKCWESWTYKMCKWAWCDSLIKDWTAIVANTNTAVVVSNSILSIWSNSIYFRCKDSASNETSDSSVITKVDNPPSMVGWITLFEDNDTDNDWLDWRDFHLTWDNTSWVNYTSFESWRIYVLPSSVTLNTSTHNPIIVDADKTHSSWQWVAWNLTDSAWSSFVDGWSYVAYIAIMSSAWILWTVWSSSAVSFHADSVSHPSILSSRFIWSTKLEITTNATLDPVVWNHDATKISYKIWSTVYTWAWVDSISEKKIIITTPSTVAASSTWDTLIALTGAIHSAGGWYNNYFSSWSLIITDGQDPTISLFTKTTAAWYWTFYKWNINFTYTFSENMRSWETRYEFERTWWVSDNSSHYNYLTLASDLTSGSKSYSFNLDSLWLVCWTTYQLRLYWKDIAQNVWYTDYITSLTYDNCGPAAATLTDYTTIWTWNLTLAWSAPLDDNGYWAWLKNYTLKLYNGSNCSSLNNTYSAITTTSKEITWLANWDYSWNLIAYDQLSNTGSTSSCDNFTVDTNVPVISSQIIKDTSLNNFSYTKNWNNIQVTANISNTDSSHIWLNMSSLVWWGSTYNNVLCSAPWTASVSCSYNAWVVTYMFPTWFAGAITDWSKSLVLTSQNIWWLYPQTKNLTITVDNTAPSVAADTITFPNGGESLWGTQTVTWNTSKISDAIWLSYIKLEYSTWTHTTWHQLMTWSNSWSYSWNLSSLTSRSDYRVRISAYDNVWNVSTDSSDSDFTIDLNGPTVPSNTITYPNWNQVVKGWATATITWNNAWIVDAWWLAASPIELYYSTDSWTNWTLIASWQPNSWTYSWAVPSINNANVKVRLIAYDNAWNHAYDISDNNFVIDSTIPSVTMTYATAGWATPPNSSKLSAGNTFDASLTTTDSYLDKVYYKLANTTDSLYWNGTSWTWTLTWNLACTDSVSVWNGANCSNVLTWINSTIVDSKSYSLVFKAVDEWWNIGTWTSISYVWDTINPVVSISNTNNSTYSWNVVISWLSSDVWAGVSQVLLQIQKWWQYWNGSSYQWTEYWLSTSTSNSYANWNYSFIIPWWDADWQLYTITAKAVDKSYKTWNSSTSSISIYKDITAPTISWWTSFFTSPVLSSIYAGWWTLNIAWNQWDVSDAASWLNPNSVKLEYWNGTSWNLIVNNETNDWSYSWTNLPSIDYNLVKIRFSIKDTAWNLWYQDSDSFVIDSTPPTIQSIETMENGITNWKINALKITMSEAIQDSSIVLSDFNIAWVWTPTSKQTWATPNDNIFILNFADYWTTNSTPTLTYTQWSLVDIAGKNLVSVSNVASTDAVWPRLLNWTVYDNNLNGKIDEIKLTFSENLSATTNTSAWTLNSPVWGCSLSSASVSTNIASLNLNEWTTDTSTGWMIVSFVWDTNWKDSWWNIAWSYPNLTLADAAKPVFVLREYYDTNSNFKVDQIKIYFSENIEWFNQGDFVINWLATDSWVNGSSVSNNLITFTLTETSLDNDTWISPTFSFTTWNLKDSSSNYVPTVAWFPISDKVPAKLLSRETLDSNWNWKIDQIKLTFSENLDQDLSSFLLSVNSYSLVDYTGSNNIVYANLVEKSTPDTSTTPQIQISSNSSLKDLAWNSILVEWSSTISTDKTWPIILWARYDEWSAGITDDKIYITFSESIQGASIDTANAATDFVINDWWSLGTDSSVTITSATTVTINLWSTASSLTPWVSKLSIQTWAIADSLTNVSPSEWVNNRVVVTASVIINEVMWSWTWSNASQYIELKNLSASSVDLSSWVIENAWWNWVNLTIPWGQSIGANWYYLIAKSNIASSLLNVSPDLVDNTLNLNPAWQNNLVLTNGSVTIDTIIASWPYGTDNPPASMERKDLCGDWTSTACWYTALSSIGFDWWVNAKWTPKSINQFDIISPSINSYSPWDLSLMPIWGFNISFQYSDNATWVWINTASENFVFSKWNSDWTSWDEYATTWVNLAWKVVSSSSAIYPLKSTIGYWKYKAHFEISDTAWNLVSKDLIFYIDNLSVNIINNPIDFGAIEADSDYVTWETTVTINTLWAWIGLNLSRWVRDWIGWMQDWDGTKWFWVDIYKNENTTITNYDNTYESIWTPLTVANNALNINSDWQINQYTYKFKYKIRVDAIKPAWIYTNTLTNNLLINY